MQLFSAAKIIIAINSQGENFVYCNQFYILGDYNRQQLSI